jgi:PEGA domain
VTSMRTIAAVALAFWILGTAPANAQTEKMALLVSGTATPHERELAGDAFEVIARNAGLAIAKAGFNTREASAINACVTAPQAWSCVSPTVRGKSLDHVAIISLATDTGPDSSPMLVITAQVLVARLDAAVVSQRFCVRCTDDVLKMTTTELTRSVLQEIAVRSGRTVVIINSTPRGARILFDGQSMGATDRSFNTFPGVHTVVLDLDGYRQEARTVQATLDKTSELSLVMRPLEAPPNQGARDDRGTKPAHNTLAPKLVIGAGALAIVAGGIALALNQSPVVAPIGSEQPQRYRDTLGIGVGLMAGGAAACLGGYLWWRHVRPPVAPSVVPLPGGATVGIARSF